MTEQEWLEELADIDAEMKTWGKPPRDLADRTPWQVAVVERSDHLMNWVLGNRPEPPPREEWLKTCPPRDVPKREG